MQTSPHSRPSGDTSNPENDPLSSGMSIAELAEQIAGTTPADSSSREPATDATDEAATWEPQRRKPERNPSAYDPSAYDPSSYGLVVTGEAITYDEAAIAQAYAAAFDAEIAQVQAVQQAVQQTTQQTAQRTAQRTAAQQAAYAAAFDAEIAQVQAVQQTVQQTVQQAIAQQAKHAAAFDAAIAEARKCVSATPDPHPDPHRIPPFSSTFPAEPQPHASERLLPYLNPDAVVQWDPAEIAIAPLPVYSQGMLANAYFFGNPRWNKKYLEEEHQGRAFCDRWHHALRRLQTSPLDLSSGWDNKVVVDLGCGPGNLFQRLGGNPALLIGVDISYGALRRAQQSGYTALLADAHHLPLRDGIADVVVANALLHHCDDMARVLAEAARLVKPGGYLITDLDPQRTAWDRRGWGLWLQQLQWPRLPGFGDSVEEQAWRIATEVHNRQPGVGIEASLYARVLEPWGFEVQLYPHNHRVGADIFVGERGRSPLKMRLSQRLSGLDPAGAEAAQSIMCVAHRSV